TFGERAGVLTVSTRNVPDLLVTLRPLPAPLGHVAMGQPASAALADWRSDAAIAFAALGGIVVALAALGLAFQWQAARARRARSSFQHIQSRTDTALARGRSGLFEWDLVRGRVFWS